MAIGGMGDKTPLESRLDELTTEYSKTKYNKATNKHLGILRKKIAECQKGHNRVAQGPEGRGFLYKEDGRRYGCADGIPSTGKSSIINALANTKSKTAAYEFTTTTVVPGVMLYNDAHIQIFDMPGIIENAHMGAGGGRSVVAAMKVADLIVFVVDIDKPWHMDMLLQELRALNVMINKPKPKVQIKQATSDIGLLVEVNKSKLSDREIQTVMSEFGIYNARVRVDENVALDDLIGFVSTGTIT